MSDRDFGGAALHDNAPLNCSEGFADKLAVGVINQLAEDERFARLLPRYIDLITQFNSDIPAENRYNFDSADLAGARCCEVNLMKNGLEADDSVNENFFRQYASAYFNRQRLMLENKDHGNLPEVIERDLLTPFYSRLEYSGAEFSLKTLGEFTGDVGTDIFLGGDDLREHLHFWDGMEAIAPTSVPSAKIQVELKAAALNDKGEPRSVKIGWETNKAKNDEDKMILREAKLTLAVSDHNGKPLKTFDLEIPKALQNSFNISDIVMPTDNELVLVLTPFDLEKRFDHVVVLHLSNNKGKWSKRFIKFTLPDLANADEIGAGWFAVPGGGLELMRVRHDKKAGTATLTVYDIDRKTFSATIKRPAFLIAAPENSKSNSMKAGLWRKYKWGEGIFGNGTGRLFVTGHESNLQLSSDGNLFEITDKPVLVMGNLGGIRDGSGPRNTRISSVAAPRFITENSVTFIDSYNKKNYIRRIEFGPLE